MSPELPFQRCPRNPRYVVKRSPGGAGTIAIHPLAWAAAFSNTTNMKILQLILLAAAIALASVSVLLEREMDPNRPTDLRSFFESRMEQCGFPGLAVALIKNGEVSWAEGFGVMDVDTGEPVTADTLFHIASVSKPVVATAVMQLAERELLPLDADIEAFLPFDVSNPSYLDVPITARILLTHSSSLQDDWEGCLTGLYTHETGGGDSPIRLEEFVRGYLEPGGRWYNKSANYLDAAPGTVYEYCNVGYALLGALVEHVSGEPFDVYCRERIFEPLGMTETNWLISQVDEQHLASPHAQEKDLRKLPHFSYPDYPSGSLRTSVVEYARFVSATLAMGVHPGGRILEEDTVREMWKPQIPELKPSLGIGWEHLHALAKHFPERAEELSPIHTGGDPGAFAYTFLMPEQRAGAVFFANSPPRETAVSTLNLIAMFKRLVLELGEPG